MTSKTKQSDIGKPGKKRKDKLSGGETWTVTYVTGSKDLGLAKGNRLRLEYKKKPEKVVLFPDVNTVLYKSYEEIPVEQIADDPQHGRTYQFEGLLNGETGVTLYLQEGGQKPIGAPASDPDPEMEIWVDDPTKTAGPGSGGGAAGIRR